MDSIRASVYPHLKKDAQTKEINGLKERAKSHRQKDLANFADVAKSLAQGMRRRDGR